jgi:single-strand DNA-binding protein
MAGETAITVIGNLTADPELRFTPAGTAVCNFTVASTPRAYDKDSGEWKDQETMFLRVNIWREAAEYAAESLAKGMRVIVTGRLKAKTFDTKEGDRRTVFEVDAEDLGPSLKHASATVTRHRKDGASSYAGTREEPAATGKAGDWGSWGGQEGEPAY